MKQSLLTFIIVSLFVIGVPAAVSAGEAQWSVAPEMGVGAGGTVSIAVDRSSVVVKGAEGKTLQVVSLAGKSVMTVLIESVVQRVELNLPQGCYIVKVGSVVRKVTLRN